MMGFEHNDIDPDEYVTMQVIKVHLRKNLPVLSPVIEKAVAKGLANELSGAGSNGGEFAKALCHIPKSFRV